ncbi:MAG: hypothetical protein ACRCT1_09060 [Microcoleaceae cyanobacterium]
MRFSIWVKKEEGRRKKETFPITDYRLPITDYRLPIPSHNS